MNGIKENRVGENMERALMKGNEAIAEAAVISGCRYFFGYPITPQTEVAAYMAKRMPKAGGVFLQAESEIAAINMVIGASGAGARVMTSSSSPGVALKSEGLSYLAGCDLPAVVVNIARGGPGLGGIQPSQSDYFMATRAGGHGDFRMITLAPYSVQEMFDLTQKAFYLADKYRVTVMMLADGILGQMMEPVVQARHDFGGLPEKDWAASGTGGSRKKNIINSLYLRPEELEAKNIERFGRYLEIEHTEPLYEEFETDGADIVIVAYGATARISRSVMDECRNEGLKVGLFRPISLWPFPSRRLKELAESVKSFLCVEMSMGQMIEDVKLSIECLKPVHFYGRVGGMVPSTGDITAKVKQIMEGENCERNI